MSAILRNKHAQSEREQRAQLPDQRPTIVYGWAIYDNGECYHPSTGRYRAWRHGVSLGSSTLSGVIRMIERRP